MDFLDLKRGVSRLFLFFIGKSKYKILEKTESV